MSPDLKVDPYVFLTSSNGFTAKQQEQAIMIFREIEGMTLITKATQESSDPKWAMITLNVHSDLNAVGFLAVITKKLAEAGISVNPVSAYYHDHLFVPWEKRELAMSGLKLS